MVLARVQVSVSVSAQDGIVALGKAHTLSAPSLQQSPQGCPRNSANICLVEHRSFSTLEDGMSAASFLHSSFLQAVSAVMLWLVRVEKIPQASEHLCPAKLQTRCDICCACQSICPFIPTDSGVPRTVDPVPVKEKSGWRKLCWPGPSGRVVCWLLNVPATCKCISETDLLRQVYVLPH